MKYNSIVALAALSSVALAQPHRHHQHQRHHEKRDVVWTTEWDYVTETVDITTTVWVDAEATPPPQVSTTSPATTTSSSTSSSTTTSQSAAEFHESTVPAPQPTSKSVYVAPYVAPSSSSSSSSIYVLPPVPSSTSVAPPQEPTTTTTPAPAVEAVQTPAYVPPTTTAAPYVAPAATTSAAPAPVSGGQFSSSSGSCTSGSPCSGDLTYYEAGLGACGITNNGETDMVIALPHVLMGTKSNDNPYCGKTVTIIKGSAQIVATVVDKCMGCDGYAIDLSNKAFSALGIAFETGRTGGTWYFND